MANETKYSSFSNFDRRELGKFQPCGSEIITLQVWLRHERSYLGHLNIELVHFWMSPMAHRGDDDPKSCTLLGNTKAMGASTMWGSKPWLHCAMFKVHPMLKDRGRLGSSRGSHNAPGNLWESSPTPPMMDMPPYTFIPRTIRFAL